MSTICLLSDILNTMQCQCLVLSIGPKCVGASSGIHKDGRRTIFLNKTIENAQKPDNSNCRRCFAVKKLLVAQILMKLLLYYVTRWFSIAGSYHEADESGPLPQILFLYDPPL
jgi:hypothetical protein